MTEYRDMLTTIHDRVAALKKEDRSLEEAIAAKVTAAYDSKWATSFLTGDVFTKLVYAGHDSKRRFGGIVELDSADSGILI